MSISLQTSVVNIDVLYLGPIKNPELRVFYYRLFAKRYKKSGLIDISIALLHRALKLYSLNHPYRKFIIQEINELTQLL